MFSHYRNLLGVVLKEQPRYLRLLGKRDSSYLKLCNRNEILEPSPDGRGFRCVWQWASDLHAPKYLPSLGLRLLRRALADHPIGHAAAPATFDGSPNVSFVIGHRGMDRLPHLLATLESIASQRGASVECLVVEQDTQSRIAGHLPAWVHYMHTPPPAPGMPYCRSWAFNTGIKHARGTALILHDNDMLVPEDYAANIVEHMRNGCEVINLKRFTFYLNEQHTRSVLSREAGLDDVAPLAIVQNLEGGGSIAIARQAFDHIGGMDESFIGWGGEDNEFWERAQTLNAWPYGYLSLVHLWHAAQPGKHQADSKAVLHYRTLSQIPVETRILRLRSLTTGRTSGPVGWGNPG